MEDSIKTSPEMQEKPIPPSVPPLPRIKAGQKFYTTEQVAKKIGVDKKTVRNWRKQGLFVNDETSHTGAFLYAVERVEQLKSVYHSRWTHGGYEPSPTTTPPETPQLARTKELSKMKKISDDTIKAICKIDAEKLADKKIIQPAHVGYICPHCSNGCGRDGTGITPTMTDDFLKWWCPVCGDNFNNLRIFSEFYGLDLRSEFVPLVEKICADFDIDISYDEKDSPRTSRKRRKKNTTKAEPVNPAELELIRADLNTSPDDLKWFVKIGCENEMWRGLPIDFLLKYGCRYVAKWIHPKIRVAKKTSIATPRVLIPCSDGESYLARLINPLAEYDEQARKFIREKEHAGRKVLFNADALTADEIVFAVEGYIDALSLIYTGFKSVALGGANEYNKLVDAVAKMQEKPRVIILLDSDKTGRDAAKKLYDELINIGCPCCVRFLSEEDSKIDCNQILTDHGEENLRGRIESMIVGAVAELDAVAREIEEKKFLRHDDELIDFLFQGDSSDLDFARRIEKFCGDDIRWLTDDKEWMLYERNEHGGGLWRRAGEQNSCLLPRVREMADVMLEFADNKDERELAEKLKRTRKNLSAITMLKSLDEILITSADLDKHPELICCLNGIVNLQDGKLYPAAPELLLTQTVKAAFGEPRKESVEFVQNFFASIMPDEMTRAGLIRWLAYCLSGETTAEKFMVWIGESGANGKGTLSKMVLSLFADYGCGLAPRALLKTNRPVDADKATTGLNGLVGKRFAISEEMPMDGELDSSLVKNLTGSDEINLRRNFKEYVTVENFAKLNISGNYTPRLENTSDGGIRRRLLNMPFDVRFGTDEHPADPTLKKKLLLPENLNALFAILVRDCANWYRERSNKTCGLIISDLMTQARDKHLSDSNFVADFLSEYYEFGEGLSVKTKDVIDELKAKYPAECRPFKKRNDLINLVAQVDGVAYEFNREKTRIFKGIGKPKPKQDAAAKDEFAGEILSSADYIPPN